MGCVKTDPRDSDGSQMDGIWVPDLVNIQKAIEHGHRNNGFSQL